MTQRLTDDREWALAWKRAAKRERERRLAAERYRDAAAYTFTTLQSEIDYWRWYQTEREATP